MLPPKGRAHDLRVAERCVALAAAAALRGLVPFRALHALRTPLLPRVAKITAAIAPDVQAKRRAEHKKTLPAKLRNAGLLQHVKKSAWEKD